MIFKAKRDWFYWLALIINMVVGGIIIYGLWKYDFLSKVICVFVGLEMVFAITMFSRCYYVAGEDNLKLVIGLISISIPYKDILIMTKVKHISLSFSLSIKCIGLSFGKNLKHKFNTFYISPKKVDQLAEIIESKGGNSLCEKT